MTKVIAAINMSLDGYCDHDKMVADEEIHDHYTNLLGTGDIILYGRKTYELMEFWPPFLKNPSGQRSLDEFAIAINRIPKLVFSNTLKKLNWNTANLAQKNLEEEVNALKKENGKRIFVGSRSLMVQLLNLNLLEELQLCIHPVLLDKGLRLFDGLTHKQSLRQTNIQQFTHSGAMIACYDVERPDW
jgi:dihydrofolate reductase